MHKLTYASQTTPAISDGDLEMILKAGRRNNTKSALPACCCTAPRAACVFSSVL
jgi:hypothetical protein